MYCCVYPSKSMEFSDSNCLTVEKDELTLTLANIWQFSFGRVKTLLIPDSGGKNITSMTIPSTPKCP